MTQTNWKTQLAEQIPQDMAHEIDLFEGQMALKKQGKIAESIFAETRLRRGAYGQRYDNGKRHDGIESKPLVYPTDETKGPDTLWDAPGMQRIKVPYGGITPDQLEVFAELADDYSDNILHITTRQDIQLHYIHIEDTPDIMRRLAAVGITTQEACGNSVRNVTACPLAGICRSQAFDVTGYADATTQFFLGHDDVQDFGRKFKIAFSGCEHEACGLVKMHDLGLLARNKVVDGETVRGFRMYVGGGLGTVPHQAKVLYDFVTEADLLPVSQAISRVFARLGEKKNRNRARLKFLIAKLGIDEFRELVEQERETMPHDDRWTDYIDTVNAFADTPLKAGTELVVVDALPNGFAEWRETNVYEQRQEGYVAVTINLPLGDITAKQAFALADITRKYVGDSLRTTVEQNIQQELVDWYELGFFNWIARPYQEGDLKGAFLVIAERDTDERNAAIFAEAERERAIVNVMDDVQHCNFVAGSVIRQGPLTISISTSGAAPAYSVRLRQQFEQEFDDAHGTYLDLLQSLRAPMKRYHACFKQRRKLWYALVDSNLMDLVRAEDECNTSPFGSAVYDHLRSIVGNEVVDVLTSDKELAPPLNSYHSPCAHQCQLPIDKPLCPFEAEKLLVHEV